MSPLAKKELTEKCGHENVDEFFEEQRFLESIEDIKYCDLLDDQRKKVDEIIESIKYNIETLSVLCDTDYYYSRMFVIRYYLTLKFLDGRFCDELHNHLCNLDFYDDAIDEVLCIVDNIKKSKIIDIIRVNFISFSSVILLINDQADYDMKLLNKEKYTDDQILDLPNLKVSVESNIIGLRNKHRLNKKQS